MKRSLTRRDFLGSGLALLVAGPAAAGAPTASWRPVLRGEDLYKQTVPGAEALVAKAKLPGKVSFAVADAFSGEFLEGAEEEVAAPPASVAKALTALYALDALGPAHRFETRILATGGVVNGEVQGDLILAGGGDPTLDTDGLAQLAADLKAAGVHGVRGAFHVHEGDFPAQVQIDPDQPDHVGYNPAVSGMALNYNRVHFEWRRENGDFTVTMDARTERYRPDVSVAVMRIEDRAAPVYTYADRGGRDHWTVAKGALGKGGARWLPVRKPALYAGEVFATLAGAHGIRLKQPEVIAALPEAELLAFFRSGDLLGILRDMLKHSTNLTAELVGLAATARRVGPVGSLRQSAAQMNRWAQLTLGMRGPALVDHSGLSDLSRLSARDMVTALVRAHDGLLRGILKEIALRDAKGRPDKAHALQVHAKTGTLNFVSGLAGYVTAGENRVLAFAIFCADVPHRATIPKAARERPPGAQGWNRRAKTLQQGLIERWGALWGS